MRPTSLFCGCGRLAVMRPLTISTSFPASVNRVAPAGDILRERWGFNGMVISRDAMPSGVRHYGIATGQERAADSILAGMDMDMTSNSYIECLRNCGARRSAGICADEAAGTCCGFKFELGLFDHPYRATATRSRIHFLRRSTGQWPAKRPLKSTCS